MADVVGLFRKHIGPQRLFECSTVLGEAMHSLFYAQQSLDFYSVLTTALVYQIYLSTPAVV